MSAPSPPFPSPAPPCCRRYLHPHTPRVRVDHCPGPSRSKLPLGTGLCPSGLPVLTCQLSKDVTLTVLRVRVQPDSNGALAIHPAVHAAKQNGVLFDIGHGMGSFNWTVAEQCVVGRRRRRRRHRRLDCGPLPPSPARPALEPPLGRTGGGLRDRHCVDRHLERSLQHTPPQPDCSQLFASFACSSDCLGTVRMLIFSKVPVTGRAMTCRRS